MVSPRVPLYVNPDAVMSFVSGPQTLRYGEVGIASLKSLGLHDITEVNILAALNNYNFGFVEDGVH